MYFLSFFSMKVLSTASTASIKYVQRDGENSMNKERILFVLTCTHPILKRFSQE